MFEHQALHLRVVSAAPIGSRQERPADFHLTAGIGKPAVAGAPDQFAGLAVYGDEGAPGFQGTPKEFSKYAFLIAATVRVLLPDQRVGGHCIKRRKVVGSDRTQFDQFSCQRWLWIE